MCTAIALPFGQTENMFGRKMDFSYPIEPKLYVMSKASMWKDVLNGNPISDFYRFIAIWQESGGILGFFDG